MLPTRTRALKVGRQPTSAFGWRPWQESRERREAEQARDEDDAGAATSGLGEWDEPADALESRLGASAREPAASLDQLERIRLTRNKLEQWLYEPFFDTVRLCPTPPRLQRLTHTRPRAPLSRLAAGRC